MFYVDHVFVDLVILHAKTLVRNKDWVFAQFFPQ
jgi:hypothetical protein